MLKLTNFDTLSCRIQKLEEELECKAHAELLLEKQKLVGIKYN
jgi:hypothetical protein